MDAAFKKRLRARDIARETYIELRACDALDVSQRWRDDLERIADEIVDLYEGRRS